jgi:steroid delta-isomerase-like uncharacterized protein
MNNVKFVHKWFEEVWNKQRPEAIYEMFSPNGIAHGIVDENGKEVEGPLQFSIFFKKFIDSFPDIKVAVEDTVSEGKKIVSRCTVSCTHSGAPFQVGSMNVPASGQKIEFTGMSWVIIRKGQIKEAWNNFDFLTMFQQIGAVKF